MGVSRHTLCFTYVNIASFAPLLNQNYLREINARFGVTDTTEHQRFSSELSKSNINQAHLCSVGGKNLIRKYLTIKIDIHINILSSVPIISVK